MLPFITTPEMLSEVAHLERQLQSPQNSIVTPVVPVQTKRSKLSMVWYKEFDGKQERLVAHWVVDR